MPVDVAIRNASIVDGTGAPPFDADLAIHRDRIVAIGDISALVDQSTEHIDVKGASVTPGFIDVHTHDDVALLAHPGLEFKLSQGCTSLVIGNCGFSAVPSGAGLMLGGRGSWTGLDEFVSDVNERRPACNWMTLVGHNTIRAVVMGDPTPGDPKRPPSSTELDDMRAHVRAAMEQGAVGFSSGLIYTPGRHASTEEVIALATEVASYGGIYTTHMRNEGDRLIEAVDEAITIARAAGVPLQISHHKAAGRKNWGKVVESLARVDAAVRDGLDVSLDVYPYVAGSGPMIQYFDLDNVDEELAANIRIASCPAFRSYESRMLADIAKSLSLTLTEAVRHVLSAQDGDKTVCIQFMMTEDDVETSLRHERVMIGSDGIPDLKGSPHPRLFGTFPRVLAQYARARQVFSFEEAVRRMTSLPADRFWMKDRGRVGEGQFADLVVLDRERVTDEATFDDPKHEASGISHVLVNGRVAFDASTTERHTGVGAGRFLRPRA